METVKKDSYSKIKRNKSSRIVFIILFLTIMSTIFVIFKDYVWPLLFAGIFYIAFRPLHDFLTKRIKYSGLSTFIIILTLILIVMLPLFLLMFTLADQTIEFYTFISHNMTIETILNYISSNKRIVAFFSMMGVKEDAILSTLIENLKDQSLTVISGMTGFIGFSVSFVINFFFMILLMSFFFQDGTNISSLIYKIIPLPYDIEKKITNKLKEVIKVLIIGNFFIMILQGFFVGVGFAIAGLQMWLVAGTLAAIFSLIPVVGTAVAWVPAAVFLVITGKIQSAVFISIWCLLWYLVLENVVKPQIFGKKLNFPPVIFFFLLLGSLKTFGLPGVIIGPIILTLFYSLWEIFKLVDLYNEINSPDE